VLIEGVSYNINWRSLRAGYSFFIPCIDCVRAKQVVLLVTKRLKLEVLIKISIEDSIKGLRIWRL
jgi:hypothetical protein